MPRLRVVLRDIGCPAAAGGGRTVVYRSLTSEETWLDGVRQRGTDCIVESGTGDDFSACCPEGFEAVGDYRTGEASLWHVVCLEIASP